MSVIRFTVPGAVRGKGRPRFVKATGRTYTDAETASYENLVKTIAQEAMTGAALLEGPLSLHLSVLRLVPASWSVKKRAAADYCTTKPDLDNVVKLVKDAMNKIVYADDSQIARLTAMKRYGDDELVMVTVETLS